ncbi:hypothetical protein MIR68_004823 [Amoeboaphelidium protococcarum]|nr:hypothetical protein MIR68_004823 [Amoeboaphelidium protococcarum]
MADWDIGSITFTAGPAQRPQDDVQKQTEAKFLNFLREYMEDNSFIYRNQLRSNLLIPEYSLTVDLTHLMNVEPELCESVQQRTNEIMPWFENAARQLAKQLHHDQDVALDSIPEIQLFLKSRANVTPMRSITSNQISKLVKVEGIVSSASTPSARATLLSLYCRGCRHEKTIRVKKGFAGVQVPRKCENVGEGDAKKCPMDPYLINHEKSKYVDQQVLKLQETPESVPVGELPRHMLVTIDRYLTNQIVPGTHLTINGVYDVFQRGNNKGKDGNSVRCPYVRAVGLELCADGANRASSFKFTVDEENDFINLARRPDIYEVFSKSIAPSIYGNDDIKKSIACLLMAGSKKILPDGARLRGDINVLLLGDPGTAKSQLLKFVQKVAPICVYTSGQGSSAAGLTASIIRDSTTRDFYLEAGAMVLADGGVVCIDEFDKMREEDRVAIHEAMEQQTISIAKAGITTILNSRTSVLAAANPVFGRYDDMKTPGENIDFQSTILSRFDMIYIIRDQHSEERDQALAKYVMSVHEHRAPTDAVEGEMDLKTMKRYIAYCRQKCAPRLSAEAAEKLSSHFVEIRSQVQKYETEANARSSVPITIRQLEAIIRITESLAKMSLAPVASEQHVDEALRLFRVSTFAATQSGYLVGEGSLLGDFKKEVQSAEDAFRKRVAVGQTVNTGSVRDFLRKQNISEYAIDRCLANWQRRGGIVFLNQSKYLQRILP